MRSAVKTYALPMRPLNSSVSRIIQALQVQLAALRADQLEQQQALLLALLGNLEKEMQIDWQAVETVSMNLLGEDQLRVFTRLVAEQRVLAEKETPLQLS